MKESGSGEYGSRDTYHLLPLSSVWKNLNAHVLFLKYFKKKEFQPLRMYSVKSNIPRVLVHCCFPWSPGTVIANGRGL